MRELPYTELWSLVLPQTRVSQSCALAAQALLQTDPFCLWLQGEVGAGKTSWVAAFFHHLGLDPNLSVTSPTFTYARAYEINGAHYNHCDLYRVSNLPAWQALGIEIHSYRGTLLEWATPTNCDAIPTHRLDITFCDDPHTRSYTFHRS